MKHLRKFPDTATRDEILANIEYEVLSYTEGFGINIKTEGSGPDIDYSIPFYIDVRETVDLTTTSGLQMSTDKINWTDTTAMTLPTGKTYFRVASDQSSPLKPIWTEDNNSDYDIGGNINSLVKTSFENDTTCYIFNGYFQNKSKLKNAGSLILPATTAIYACYGNMFRGCTSLTTAPELPATTLADECYYHMFEDCSSLTTAPELPALTLVDSCYVNMFNRCTSLNYIKCLATNISASGCTGWWLKDVAATGTFVKDSSMSDWTTGNDGIPEGWTVQDAV